MPTLRYGGYTYYKMNYTRGPKATWFCCRGSGRRSKGGCRGSIVVFGENVIALKNEHNH